MKTLILVSALSVKAMLCAGQNIGIGTASPAEKLDVNGNVNLSGQLKVGGNAGVANQVLMKDASNNLAWGNLSEFKNLLVFDCNSIANTIGTGNCSSTWFVPAGVTTILVECWGGGGGGSTLTGGGGGGYVSAKFTVTAGASVGLVAGAGGNYGTIATTGIDGGNSTVTVGAAVITGYGGLGGFKGDPFGSPTDGQASGGAFGITGILSQFNGYFGSPGGISKLGFVQAGATDFAKYVNFGDGGDAALLPGSGGKGGYKLISATANPTIYATQFGIQPGGGGGSDPTGGFYGHGGRIIIRW
jgi:hypothetical protein